MIGTDWARIGTAAKSRRGRSRAPDERLRADSSLAKRVVYSKGFWRPKQAEARSAPDPPRRILVVLLGSIGDVVRALALLGRLRRAHPEAHIAWAVEPKSRPILEGHPWLDEIVVFERGRRPGAFVAFLARVRAGKFDLVLDLQRHLKSGLAALASGAPVRLGFPPQNAKELNHIFSTRWVEAQPPMRLKLLQYQAFADALGIPASPIEFGLEPRHDELRRVRALLEKAPRPLVGAFLGSSWPSRLYPADWTARVLKDLAGDDQAPPFFPVLIGASADRERALAVASQLSREGFVDLVGRLGLRELVALFRECTAAFGPDCGPMHIAAAVGCPVVSLWGATAPQRSAPWASDKWTLCADIPCHPCYLRRCPIGGECMRRIEPDAVAAAVREAARSAGAQQRPALPAGGQLQAGSGV